VTASIFAAAAASSGRKAPKGRTRRQRKPLHWNGGFCRSEGAHLPPRGERALSEPTSLDGYLDALASAEPTPGGGSAACLVAATGAALVAMVARITLTNPRHGARHDDARRLADEADTLRLALQAARTADEAAYGEVVRAGELAKSTPEEKAVRTSALQAALRHASAEPLRAAALAVRVLRLTERARALENRNLASDLGCAAEFAAAAVAAAGLNVRVNHAYIKDPDYVRVQEAELHHIEREVNGLRRAG
jgi:formiminotetrahydrofolate cyclodeaminase